MTENNTNIKITEDIYNKFYNTLLVEIKKVIKKFQWKRATKKYRENNKEKFNENQNKANLKYYHNNKEYRNKQLEKKKNKYQTNIEYKLSMDKHSSDYYHRNIHINREKARLKYQLMKNIHVQNLEINNNVIASQ